MYLMLISQKGHWDFGTWTCANTSEWILDKNIIVTILQDSFEGEGNTKTKVLPHHKGYKSGEFKQPLLSRLRVCYWTSPVKGMLPVRVDRNLKENTNQTISMAANNGSACYIWAKLKIHTTISMSYLWPIFLRGRMGELKRWVIGKSPLLKAIRCSWWIFL